LSLGARATWRTPARCALLALLATGATLASSMARAAPSFREVQQAFVPSDLTLLDRHGTPIQTVRVDHSVRRLSWVALSEVSPALREAFVHSEDQRFWAHSGVDWRAMAYSAWANAWNRRTRGASTITMQLAGLIDPALARPQGGRSIATKVSQTFSAHALDKQWRKSEILEAYLNLLPYRGELVGINALSQTLFGKHPSGLNAEEAAITAALVRGPNAAPGLVGQRACQVLAAMQAQPFQPGQCGAIDLLTRAALARQGGMPMGEQIAPHAARAALAEARRQGWGSAQRPWPAQIQTTLDARLQRLAHQALRQQLAELNQRHVEDGAAIVLDNATGEVLAWVGSGGSLASAPEVDGVLARRQPGSTLKPFVYELAFERRLITPATLLDDSPVQLPTGNGFYTPQNYDKQFKGWVSVRQALGSSLNIPAVRVGAMLGADALGQRLNSLGLSLKEPGSFYGPGLALGSAEVTLRDLANAYRTLAREGLISPVRLLPAPTPHPSKPALATRALQASATHLITRILADNNARAATFGLGSTLATRGFAAVKTGTSKDMRDNWCLGYTSRYTVGVWVGNASGEPMQNVSGVTGAAPIWAQLVSHLHEGQISRMPEAPKGVISQTIRFEGLTRPEPERTEWFIVGTEQAVWQAGSTPPERAIASPRAGSILALDPDMPAKVQQVVFEAQPQTGGMRKVSAQAAAPLSWWLDGRQVATGPRHHWQPWPGKHRLALKQGDQTLDEMPFEVRGANLAPAGPQPMTKPTEPTAVRAVHKPPPRHIP
jgi:penicillin-binding protein 1C